MKFAIATHPPDKHHAEWPMLTGQEWQSLIQQFTGDDAALSHSLQWIYQQEGAEVASRGIVDSEANGVYGERYDSHQKLE